MHGKMEMMVVCEPIERSNEMLNYTKQHQTYSQAKAYFFVHFQCAHCSRRQMLRERKKERKTSNKHKNNAIQSAGHIFGRSLATVLHVISLILETGRLETIQQ